MKKLITVGMLLAFAASARGEFYIGASAVTTSSSIENGAEDLDSDELGWKVYGGYNLFKFVGVEGGYRDLGNFSEGGDFGAIDLDLKVIDAAARVYVPIVPILNVFAKAGYANISWDGRVNLGDEIDNFDRDDWELFYGIGAEVNLGENFAIRAEWELYDTSDDLDSISVGVVFRF